MKKTFFLILTMFIVLSAYPQQVTRQEVVNAALNTMKHNGRTSLTKSSILSVNSKSKGDTVLIYEILFRSGEMVLLSGNKSCIPVLGYSLPTTTSMPQSILDNYSDIPYGLQDMLTEYEEQILYCFRNNLTSFHYEDWQDLQLFESGRAQVTDIVSPLLTTEWGQDKSNDILSWAVCNAYNYYVTSTNANCTCSDQKCPTGCVATAMAQIMKYWNFPIWQPNRTEQFDWCNMPDELIYVDNPDYIVERNAIARLMKDCGDAVNMAYCGAGCNSVASDEDVPNAFTVFGYSYDATFKKRGINTTNWLNMLKNDLEAARPVYYRGENQNGTNAHAFICDGYRSDNTFHFNWGMNGNFNITWWTVDQLYPYLQNYNYRQAAVFNIHPSTTQDYCNFELPLWIHYYLYYNAYGNTTPDPYANVPKTFTRLTSVPNDPQFQSSWRTIPTGAISEYVAHEEVLLQDGFLAEPGSDFYAHIEPCPSCATRDEGNTFADNDTFPTNSLAEPKSLLQPASLADDATLKVYPNPTDNLLNVELYGAEIKSVGLYDLQGRVVTGVCDTPLQGTVTINVRNVPASIYLLRVTDTKGRSYARKVTIR